MALNALLAVVVSTPRAAPLIAAARFRRGSTNSARGAAKLLGDAPVITRRAGVTALIRADGASYAHDIVAACGRAGARFSITARLTRPVGTAISSIDEQAWVQSSLAPAMPASAPGPSADN